MLTIEQIAHIARRRIARRKMVAQLEPLSVIVSTFQLEDEAKRTETAKNLNDLSIAMFGEEKKILTEVQNDLFNKLTDTKTAMKAAAQALAMKSEDILKDKAAAQKTLDDSVTSMIKSTEDLKNTLTIIVDKCNQLHAALLLK